VLLYCYDDGAADEDDFFGTEECGDGFGLRAGLLTMMWSSIGCTCGGVHSIPCTFFKKKSTRSFRGFMTSVVFHRD
jgi:hypothetical protein